MLHTVLGALSQMHVDHVVCCELSGVIDLRAAMPM